jgi:hypothetical protein
VLKVLNILLNNVADFVSQMKNFVLKHLLIISLFLASFLGHATEAPEGPSLTPDFQSIHYPRHQYVERQHTFQESLKNIGLVYGLTWIVYPTFQPKVFKVKNGWKTYKQNFGKVVFDKDEPFWNNLVHPITGSQLYLLYRADGYTRLGAIGMAAISSTLFELTVETLTEPASVQDLYQTPVLGTILGLGIETLSMELLNSDSRVSRFFGHLINPATLMPFYQGRAYIIPNLDPKDKGAMLRFEVGF